MFTPTKEQLAAVMNGHDTTDKWDVLVSYSEGPLNTLLKENWGQHMTASFPIDKNEVITDDGDDEDATPKKRTRHTHLDVKLSEPRLQFNSAIGDGYASLVMDLDGTYYQVWDNKKPKRSHPIPSKTYQLTCSFPISVVKGSDTPFIPKRGEVIVFKDDQVKSYTLVLHIENKTSTLQIKKREGTPDNPADGLVGSEGIVMAKLLSKLKSLDFHLAKVSNAKNNQPGDTDYLRPRSFKFAAKDGLLHVFIRTMGSEGEPEPRFNIPGSTSMRPIPRGSEASIIISNRLFRSFVTSQIKQKCIANLSKTKTVEEVEGISSGVKWSLYLSGDKTWNLGNDIGLRKYQINTVSTSFDQNPLYFKVCDDDQLVPRTSWDFNFEVKVSWKSDNITAGVPDYRCGLTKITANLSEKGKPFGTLSGDTLNLELDYDTNKKPKMSFEALSTSVPGYNPTMEIPPALKEVSITLPSFKTKLTGLNFFSSQNVFVPGIRFINATQVMVPHDVLLIGDMPKHAVTSASTAFDLDAMRFDAVIPEITVSEDAKARAKAFLDKVYSDGYYLGNLMRTAADGNVNDMHALLAQNDWRSLTEETFLRVLEEHTALGPNFDLRYAGGLYSHMGSDESSLKQLMVHPVHRTIYVDGHKVKSQVQHADGRFTFDSHDGNKRYDVLFHCECGPNTPYKSRSFKGKEWRTSQPEASAISIAGNRILPWSEIESTNNEVHKSTASIDNYAYQSLVLAMDLMDTTKEDQPAEALASTVVPFAEVITTTLSIIGGVLGIIAACWAIDKGLEEGIPRFQKRVRGIRKIIQRRNLDSVVQNFDMVRTTIDTVKNMEHEVARAVNRHIEDPMERNQEKIIKAAKPDIDTATAKFLYGMNEYTMRKKNKCLYELCDMKADDITVEYIVENLNKFVDEQQYDGYIEAVVTHEVAERQMDQSRQSLKSLQANIRKAGKEIKEKQRLKQILEAARVEREKDLVNKEGLTPTDAKAKVNREIESISSQIESREKELNGLRQEREKNIDIENKSRSVIERSKRAQKERSANMWKNRKAAA